MLIVNFLSLKILQFFYNLIFPFHDLLIPDS